ncbi:MAG TPA: hypothetical protein VFI25_13640 [Planctomycetota bacterium]|nr:hypothetical protein [Planctomycetota bacterium]
MVTASLAANHALSGEDPEGYRWTNLLAHAGCVLLVRALGLRLRLSPAAALSSAAAFSVFPYGPGAVAWVIGRVDSFAAVFALAALVLHLRGPGSGRTLSLACAALAFGSKEVALALPFILLAAEGWNLAQRLRRTAPTLLLLGAFLAWRRAAIGSWLGGYPIELSFRACVRAALGVVESMGGTIAPIPGIPVGAKHLLALLVCALGLKANPRVAGFGIAFWVLFSLPALSSLQEPENLPNLRNFYLPAAGLSLVLGSLAGLGRGRLGVALFAALFLWMALGFTRSARDHLAAGAEVAAIREGVDREAAGCATPPVFVAGVPRARGSAYLFNWGFGSAMRPPFRTGGPPVLLLRPLFPQSPALESEGAAPAGRCLLRIGEGGSVARVPPRPPLPLLTVRCPGLGPVLTEKALQAALDGPDFPFEFDPTPIGPVRAVLFTSLGYNEASLSPRPAGLVRGVFNASFAPGLTLTHAIVQAFDAGDRSFFLYFRAPCEGGERESDLLEVRFAEDVARAFRAFHAR